MERRRGRSQGSAKAGLANPLAPPGAPLPHPEREGERKKGEGRARVHKNGACGALAFLFARHLSRRLTTTNILRITESAGSNHGRIGPHTMVNKG